MRKESIENNGQKIDYYRLFYVEAIMQDSAFPQINKVKPIFEHLSLEEFLELVERVFNDDNYETTTQFLYFLLLFRDMPNIQNFINSKEFGIKNLEKLIIFIFGFCSRYDMPPARIIDEVLYFLSNDRLIDLVLESEYIHRDKLLLFFILTKFDTVHLNHFFAAVRNVEEFTKYFINLPDDVLRMLISRNYLLFQYIMLMMSEGHVEHDKYIEFMNRYKNEMDQFSKLHDIIRKYKRDTKYEKDRNLPFNMRDMGRISFLVNMVKDLPDPERAINYFNSESVFMDDFEKKIVYAIVTDPLLKNILKDYDRMLDTPFLSAGDANERIPTS